MKHSCIWAAKEARWLSQRALMFQHIITKLAIILYIDSQGVNSLAKNLVHHSTSNHIEIWCHLLGECITQKGIVIDNILTLDNISNAMIKSLVTNWLWSLSNQMGLKLILILSSWVHYNVYAHYIWMLNCTFNVNGHIHIIWAIYVNSRKM